MGVFTREPREELPPGLTRAEALPLNTPRPITAAAARIRVTDKGELEQLKKRKGTSEWQKEAWEYFDAVGEIKYAFMLTGAVTSRIKLYAAISSKPSDPPSPAEDISAVEPEMQEAAQSAVNHLERLNSCFGGIPGMLREISINLSVPGEALDVDTPVATPDGLRRIGDLRDGDIVYGGDGRPCMVVKAHPIREGRPCYEVGFTGGVSVVADAEHLWQTHTKLNRQYAQQYGRPYEPSVVTTEEMASSLHHVTKGGSKHINHAIPLTTIPGDPEVDRDLPVDPYLLGYWLGDGVTTQAAITAHPMDQDHLRQQVEKAGYEFKIRPCGRGFQAGINGGFLVALRQAGVLGNKHIPDIYFRASMSARLALLQGLMDSDGHIGRDGYAEFSNTNKQIMWGFIELASSLGVRVNVPKVRPDGTGRVGLSPCGVQIARLPRKAERLKESWERDRWRYVKRVTPVPSRPVRCITVDSLDSTFLVTEHLIRTHNCYLVQQLADPVTGAPEQWNIRSTDEVSIDGSGNIQIQTSRAMGQQGQVVMPSSAFVGRIWRPHPRYHDEADSSMRALLGLCLAEGTAVYTPRGPRPIEDIVAGDEVLAMQDGHLVRATVSEAAKTGMKAATLMVTTSQGHVITGTADHRVQVLQYDNPGKGRRRTYELAYKRLGDLTFDDFVVATNGTDGLTDSVDPMPYSEAWLAGVYIGDGTYPKQGARVQICWPDPLLASDIDRHAREIWGSGTTSKGVDLSLPKGSRAWIRELGLQGKSHERRIPERIWEGGPKVWRAFLDGYERTDGYRTARGHLTYDSTSLGMLRDLQAMCRMLGMRTSSIAQVRTAGLMNIFIDGMERTIQARDAWRIDVYDTEARTGRKTLIDRKPAVAALLPDERLTLAKVKRIEVGPKVDVYDLTVPGADNFVAEGVVVHNCEELLLLNRTVRATAKSRLNAGALFIPDGLSVAAQPDIVDEDGVEEYNDAFEEELIAAMTAPIADEESASAVVPLLIRGPGELGTQIKQFKFERSFDAALAQRADRVLERIMQGIDVPKDVVTGLANVKYSNAIVINESMYRAHVEPLTLLICDALTMIFMRPALEAMGYPPEVVERILVWYDPSDILTSQDRAESANAGWDRYLISGQAWRNAHGFAETDAPTGEELVKRISVARGQMSPEFAEGIYQQLAPALAKAIRGENIAGAKAPMPDSLQQLLEGGAPPPPSPDQEPLPPEILEGLPLDFTGAAPTPEAAPVEEEPVEEALPPEEGLEEYPAYAAGSRRG